MGLVNFKKYKNRIKPVENAAVYCTEDDDDVESERRHWGNQAESILALISFAVGLSNFWRFPYLCSKNGGAFFIPYLILTLFLGLPLVSMELCLGQIFRLGPNKAIRKISPLMEGVGWGLVIVTCLVSVYYNFINAWTLHYLLTSIAKLFGYPSPGSLPWTNCRNPWNTEVCYDGFQESLCQFNNTFDRNGTCRNFNELFPNADSFEPRRKSASEEYFETGLLNISDGLETMGSIQWELVAVMAAAWVLVFTAVVRGVKSLGKVVYVTTIVPYLIMIVLLVRGVTLDGASDGIAFYLTPNFTKLFSLEVWMDAAMQMFFSLGLGFGCLIMIGSYNMHASNCFRDATIVVFADFGTSILSGFIVLPFTAFIANQTRRSIDEMMRTGIGLAYMLLPDVFSRMPGYFAPTFFVMLLMLGLGTQCIMTQTYITALMDQSRTMAKWPTITAFVACLMFFLAGIPLCFSNGIYILSLLDNYSSGYNVFILTFLEVILVAYIYGLKPFVGDVEMMLGKQTGCMAKTFGRTGFIWKIGLWIVAPLSTAALLVSTIIFHAPGGYGEYENTAFAVNLGWFISALPWIAVPLFMLINLVENRLNKLPFRKLFVERNHAPPAEKCDAKPDPPVTHDPNPTNLNRNPIMCPNCHPNINSPTPSSNPPLHTSPMPLPNSTVPLDEEQSRTLPSAPLESEHPGSQLMLTGYLGGHAVAQMGEMLEKGVQYQPLQHQQQTPVMLYSIGTPPSAVAQLHAPMYAPAQQFQMHAPMAQIRPSMAQIHSSLAPMHSAVPQMHPSVTQIHSSLVPMHSAVSHVDDPSVQSHTYHPMYPSVNPDFKI